jgi:hypothetical protein
MDQSIASVDYRNRMLSLGGSQNNGTDNDTRVSLAEPSPSRIVSIAPATGGGLSISWQGAMEPITLLHTISLLAPDWQPVLPEFWDDAGNIAVELGTHGYFKFRE